MATYILERTVGSEKNPLFCVISRQTTARTNCRWAAILHLVMQGGESVGARSRILVEHGACALEYNQTQSLVVQERPRSVLHGAFVARSQSLHLD